jgi:hypothetical protein
MVLAWVTVERSVAADRARRAEVQAREMSALRTRVVPSTRD